MKYLSKLVYIIGFVLLFISLSLSIYFALKMNDYREASTISEIPPYQYHFVLVPEEVDNDYWKLVEGGAKEAAELYGVLLEYAGPKQGNVEEHLKTLEIAAASNVNGIITQSLNEEEFPPLIHKLISDGIPVITIDTDAENSDRISYIGTNNYYAGFLAGKALLQDTTGSINIAVITGNFHTSNQILRVNGFKDAVKNEDRIQIIAIEESKISQVRAAEKAYQILMEHPEVNAFYGTSALDGIGIAQSVLKENKADDMYIIGFDLLDETVEYMKNGIIDATVVQQPYEMGYQAVELMVKIKEGDKVPKLNYTDAVVMHIEDIRTNAIGEPSK